MPFFYRDDIFAKHSLQVPKTWEELYAVSKKLKELYPDSYPFVFRHGIGTLNAFGPQFGHYPGFYEDPATGKFVHGVTQPGFKKMVEMLNKFYKDGLIPPDWLSMDYKAWTQFITTNKSFISIQYIGQIETMNDQLKDGAHLKFMPPQRQTNPVTKLHGVSLPLRRKYLSRGYQDVEKTLLVEISSDT